MSHVPAERCLDIIALLADGATAFPLGEVAERVGLPKSGAHRLLATLVELGWAEQDAGTGYYRLTMRLATLGQKFFVSTRIPDVCQPVLDDLAARTREFARLAVVDGDVLTWVAQAQGAVGGLLYQPPAAMQTVPLHVTASGRAWLATLPTVGAMERVLKSGSSGTSSSGEADLPSPDELMRQLQATAKRGYGIAINEAERGVSAVACAICCPRVDGSPGAAVGTVSVAAPSVRMPEARLKEVAQGVRSAAVELAALWPLRPRPMMDASPRRRARADLQAG